MFHFTYFSNFLIKQGSIRRTCSEMKGKLNTNTKQIYTVQTFKILSKDLLYAVKHFRGIAVHY